MDLSTNIIRNVYNIGTNSCDAGTQYCTNEYSLYFPCLKDVTRGQNVCFDFYVADGNTQDVVDLRTVESISLNLTGQYNCSYGTFSYPDNIFSLQTEKYSEKYNLNFDDKELCCLNVIMIDKDTEDILNSIGNDDSESICFWSGTKIKLEAEDTPTHIFIGWAKIDESEEECDEDTLEDYVFSTSKIYHFNIKENTNIVAVYRKRKKYNVVSDPLNRSSYFKVNYNYEEIIIANRAEEMFDIIEGTEMLDEKGNPIGGSSFDVLEDVLEGYPMVVKCEPCYISFDSDSDSDDDMSFKFKQWKDENKNRCRKFIIGGTGKNGTKYFEDRDGKTIKLKAICEGPISGYREPAVDDIPCDYNFDEEGIHASVHKPFTDDEYIQIEDYSLDTDIYDFVADCEYVKYSEDVCKKYTDEMGYLYFNNEGRLVLSSDDIEKGIKIDIDAIPEDENCELHIRLITDIDNPDEDGEKTGVDFDKNDDLPYSAYFTNCNKSYIEITSVGNYLIKSITVSEEVLVNGGKAKFCLDSETTSTIPSGPLSVTGAIAVGDDFQYDDEMNPIPLNVQAYGLTTTVIGNVNRIPKITIVG